MILSCVNMTPFGVDVVPLVKQIVATSSGFTCYDQYKKKERKKKKRRKKEREREHYILGTQS